MKPFLVLYATREGHTRRIAEHVAATIRAAGHEAHLLDAGKVHDTFSMSGYAGSILAASVHMGHHEREMIAFVKRHRDELNRAPTAFLSVSMSEATVEDTGRPAEVRARAAEEIRKVLETFYTESGWRPKHVKAIAGALMFTQYGMLTRFVMKLISKHNAGPTDTSHDYVYTDWEALDHFVSAVVADAPQVLQEGSTMP
jgi:menaquinone-dependent protoporphyrinogen oxidase